jgi:predicted PurR-regulated permease PerM
VSNIKSPRRSAGLGSELSESQFQRLLDNISKMSLVLIACVVMLAALQAGQVILAPVFLAVIVGLMFGPVADRLERHGLPSALSSAAVVLLLLALLVIGVVLFAVPLSDWVERGPQIWQKLQAELMNWKEPLESLTGIIDRIRGVFSDSGETAMPVTVEDGSAITDIAMIFPAVGTQFVIFLVSLYFYVATRDNIRVSILSVCVGRRMRWRTAHVFRDVEAKVSRFLLWMTFINVGVGVSVALAMMAIGLPSPILWGAMAAVLNYIPYLGQAVMVVVLLAVGLATQSGPVDILLPVGCYLVINFIEAQIVTPHFIGRSMTLNPLLIFVSIAYWMWAWGPVGSLVAVPSLVIVQSVLTNVLPTKSVAPRRPVRRTANMTDNDMVLASAAAAIRDKARDEEEKAEKHQDKPLLAPTATAPDGASSPVS